MSKFKTFFRLFLVGKIKNMMVKCKGISSQIYSFRYALPVLCSLAGCDIASMESIYRDTGLPNSVDREAALKQSIKPQVPSIEAIKRQTPSIEAIKRQTPSRDSKDGELTPMEAFKFYVKQDSTLSMTGSLHATYFLQDEMLPLIKAVQSGNCEIVRMVAKLVDVNLTDENGWSALTWAASGGEADIVKKLYELDADIMLLDAKKCPIYLHAYNNGHEQVCAFLEKYFVSLVSRQLPVPRSLRDCYLDPSSKKVIDWSKNIQRKLWEDIQERKNWFVGFTLRLYSDAHEWKDGNGRTALLHAVACGNFQVAQELVRRGSRVDACDNQKKSVFELHSQVSELKNRPDKEAAFTEFLDSQRGGLVRLFEVLRLGKKNELSDEIFLGYNPWHMQSKEIWSQEDKDKILCIVLDPKFDEELGPARGAGGGSSFPYEIRRMVIALAACLGADLKKFKSEVEAPWNSPLTWSADTNDYQLAYYLLKKGAPIGKDDLKHCYSVPMAQLLLEYNALVPDSIVDDVCKSDKYQLELLKFYIDMNLEPKEISFQELGHLLVKKPSGSSICTLMKLNKVDVFEQRPGNAFKSGGFTLLHTAAQEGNKETCRAIVNYFWHRHKGFLLFFMHLREVLPSLYVQSGLFQKYFADEASNQVKLVQLLRLMDYAGATAWHRLEIPELNPNTYIAKHALKKAKKIEGREEVSKKEDNNCVCH